MAGTRAVIERFGRQVEALERARDAAVREAKRLRLLHTIDEALLDAIASHEGTARFEADLARLVDAPVRVLEVADGGSSASTGPARVANLGAILAAATPDGDLLTAHDSTGAELILAPAIVDGRALGALACPSPVEELTIEVLRRAARSLGALLSFERALSDAAARENHELLTTLITGRPLAEMAGLAQRVRALGVALSEPLVLASVAPVAGEPARALQLIASRSEAPVIGAVHDGHGCVLTNAADPEALARSWSRLLASRGMNSTVAVEAITTRRPESRAAEVRELAAVPAAHESALRILRAASQLGRAGEAVTRATLGIAALILGDDASSTAASIVRVMIGELIAHDDRHRTHLTETARVFLDSNQRVASTAESLHLHENTVRQRIARIDHILGERWRHGATTLDTHVALRLHQLTVSDRHMI